MFSPQFTLPNEFKLFCKLQLEVMQPFSFNQEAAISAKHKLCWRCFYSLESSFSHFKLFCYKESQLLILQFKKNIFRSLSGRFLKKKNWYCFISWIFFERKVRNHFSFRPPPSFSWNVFEALIKMCYLGGSISNNPVSRVKRFYLPNAPGNVAQLIRATRKAVASLVYKSNVLVLCSFKFKSSLR